LVLAIVLAVAYGEASRAANPTVLRGGTVSAPVAPHAFAGDVRRLPKVRSWQPGDPITEGPVRRQTRPQNVSRMPEVAGPGQADPLLAVQEGSVLGLAPRAFTPPELDFDGQGFSGVAPPDPVGDVGPTHYIQMINDNSGGVFEVFEKSTGGVVAGPSALSSLWTGGGPCASGYGDGIVLFDPLASRWLMSEFAASGSHLCVYISQTSDPLGGWFTYDFATPQFPDYPKYAVWPDAYYVTTNESAPAVYALDRAKMLAGLPATYQRFTANRLGGFGFQALTPADLDGSTPPPAGSPGLFMRHRDDEVTNPASNDPLHDFLELWALHVDFATPANSTFGLTATIPVSEFDSTLCGVISTACFPQPGTARRLDPIREVIMWRLQYRNFGSHEALLGNFVTDVDGNDQGGIRWFELRNTGGPWGLFQEGTYAPDAHDRWLGSIAMDGTGNVALGYSISGSTVFPGIRYTGRVSSDPLGAMTVGETTVVNGGGSQTFADRWGDYSSISVDPVDDCTFWYTNEYIPSGGLWQTRIARFRFANPTCVASAAPVCGNNVKEVGEDCDGSDAPWCPGLCQGNCTCPAPVCGNNVVEVGEECDGTSAGACASGACAADCTCQICPAAPSTGCRTAEARKSTIVVKDLVPTADTRDKVTWKWKHGAATSLVDFAGPVSGAAAYTVCFYDSSANPQPLMQASIPPGSICGSRPCWTSITNGFRYSNSAGTPDGITRVKLKAGVTGAAQVLVTGKGVNLHTPNPPLTLPVTVQLLIQNGATTECWQTQYTAPTKNDDQRFRARGP
jgi:hypothetical protein